MRSFAPSPLPTVSSDLRQPRDGLRRSVPQAAEKRGAVVVGSNALQTVDRPRIPNTAEGIDRRVAHQLLGAVLGCARPLRSERLISGDQRVEQLVSPLVHGL